MSVYKETPSITVDLAKTLNESQEFQEDWEGLSPASLAHFEVRRTPNSVQFPYYRYGDLQGFKVRVLDAEHGSRFHALGDVKDTDLFGMRQAGGHKTHLIITEGEKDAVSAYQMVMGWHQLWNVVSIPTGASLKKDGTGVIHKGVKLNEAFIKKHEKVYLCLDQDEPGQAVAVAIAKWLGEKALIVKFSEKDCNDMLQAGKEEEFLTAISQAEPYRPQELFTLSDLSSRLTETPAPRYSYPWPTLNKLTGGGMKLGDVVGWGAGPKVGKTNSAIQLTEHLLREHNEPVGMFYLENDPLEMVQMVSGKILKDISVADGEQMTPEQLRTINPIIQGKVWAYGGRADWEHIKDTMHWLSASEGVKFFFVDPLTAMMPGGAGEAFEFLNNLMREMTQLAKSEQWHINYYSHLNSPVKGDVHSEGGKVLAEQFTGSKAMHRFSQLIMGIERNTQAEDDEVRSTSWFKLLAGRGLRVKQGKFPVKYDEETGDYLEPSEVMETPGGLPV